MELLNNWVVQVILGNIIWIVFCKVVKYLKSYLKDIDNHSTNSPSTDLYPKSLLQKQFKISFWIASISTIVLLVMLFNSLQYTFPCTFVSLIIVVFFCYLFMLGAFDGALEHFDN